MSKAFVQMFTDGACSGNPGPGACCAILIWGNYNKVVRHSYPRTTNNLMELIAVLSGLEVLKRPAEVVVYTDSINVIGWLYGWDTVKKTPDGDKKFKIKKPEIRAVVDAIHKVILDNNLDVTFKHVKGHNGNQLNELANRYAQEGVIS